MASVSASRFAKFLEAFSYFADEVLLTPEDEWLKISAIDKTHVIAAYGDLKLKSPLYDKFAIKVKPVLRFLKHIHGEIDLKLEGKKLIIEGHNFSRKFGTIDPNSLKLISEPQLSFDCKFDVLIEHLVDVHKRLKTDIVKYDVGEVRVQFLTRYLSLIIHALAILSRLPNATFCTIELKTNHPARFTLKDDDLIFRAYIAPRVDD
jgi:hypothetical protein